MATSYRIGETGRDGTFLATAGQTWTRVASSKHGVSSVWSPTITDLGGGAYQADQDFLADPGTWIWFGQSTDGSTWVIEWEVEATAATSGASSSGLAKSLQAMRREIGKDLGDLLLTTATEGGVSDSVWVDANRLVGAQSSYKGRTLSVTGGTVGNLLESRRVDDSSRSSTSLTLVRELPQTIQLGDSAELWGKHDEGWQPWEVNDTINNVIEDAGANFFIPVEASVTLPFDTDTRSIAVPASITKGVVSLSYLSDADDLWYPVHEQADEYGNTGYFVQQGLRTITIGGDVWPALLDGLSLKIVGYGVPDRLDVDSDVTDVNKEWIVKESMVRLLQMGMERKPEVCRAKLPNAIRFAEIARQRVPNRPAPGWKKL